MIRSSSSAIIKKLNQAGCSLNLLCIYRGQVLHKDRRSLCNLNTRPFGFHTGSVITALVYANFPTTRHFHERDLAPNWY
jgi:hypothetical protein